MDNISTILSLDIVVCVCVCRILGLAHHNIDKCVHVHTSIMMSILNTKA